MLSTLSSRFAFSRGLAGFRRQRAPLRVVTTHHVRAIQHAQPTLQMLAHGDAAARQSPTPAASLDLQDAVIDAHRVVPAPAPLVLDRESPIPIPPPRGYAVVAHVASDLKLYHVPPEKRTSHLLIEPDILCATNTNEYRTLRERSRRAIFVGRAS